MQPPITAATSLTGGSTPGSSFVETGFGSPAEARSGPVESVAFGPEKMAFAAAAAAMAAANSNNAKGQMFSSFLYVTRLLFTVTSFIFN